MPQIERPATNHVCQRFEATRRLELHRRAKGIASGKTEKAPAITIS